MIGALALAFRGVEAVFVGFGRVRRGQICRLGDMVGDTISHRPAKTKCSNAVPRISEFYGIVIAMYYREHGVAHFHATYAGATVVIAIETSEVIAGSVPARALRLVQEWTELHREELMQNWERARAQAPLERIEPLA
jgi:hypothetical protein